MFECQLFSITPVSSQLRSSNALQNHSSSAKNTILKTLFGHLAPQERSIEERVPSGFGK
jgi:hypothetical protein